MVVPAKPRSLALLGMTPLRWDGEIELGWRDRPGMRSVPGDDGYPDPVDYQWVPLGPPSLLSTHRK